ncbi:putative ribonuclease H protein [Nymphaea thermarum]|nr:putative ribonuclease H protein [Nymphaea thermarum]
MAAVFLWGDIADNKNYHRIKWVTLCLSKLEGGVRLRDIKETNLANMAFLVYRVSQQTSLWVVFVKGWYCKRKGLLNNMINENVGWKIGNGALAKFWTDHWGVERLIDKIPISHLHLVQDTITSSVKELIEENEDYLMDFLGRLNIPLTWQLERERTTLQKRG